jgi:hypothetical protein
MTLRRRPQHAQSTSRDEQLAEALTAYFVGQAPWPTEFAPEAQISRDGFQAVPPTPYGMPWRLESGERWLAHGLGTYFFGLEARGEFKRAGAAALLVTNRGLRLLLGNGGPEKPSGWLLASKGGLHAAESRLDAHQFGFRELQEIGAGDLVLLRFWRLEPLVLRLPWPRSMAALISGLRAIERQPRALEVSTVDTVQHKTPREIVVQDKHRRG